MQKYKTNTKTDTWCYARGRMGQNMKQNMPNQVGSTRQGNSRSPLAHQPKAVAKGARHSSAKPVGRLSCPYLLCHPSFAPRSPTQRWKQLRWSWRQGAPAIASPPHTHNTQRVSLPPSLVFFGYNKVVELRSRAFSLSSVQHHLESVGSNLRPTLWLCTQLIPFVFL
jgi:hypothetical protein